MAYVSDGYTLVFWLTLFQLLQETLCIMCKTQPAEGSLLRFSYKQCAFSCCGEEDNQYCCMVSKSVIIGCAAGAVFLVIIAIGTICYLVNRSRKKRYQRSIRARPRSVSAVSTVDSFTAENVGRKYTDLEVRRFSQLSQASIPSQVHHVPVSQRPKSNNVRVLAMATVPTDYTKPEPSGVPNGGFVHA